jgi:hypothetical protein
LLQAPQQSSFYLSDADFFRFLSENRGSLALQPTPAISPPAYVKAKLSVSAPAATTHADPVKPFRLRGDQHLVLRPTGAGRVEVKFSRVATHGTLVTYSVYRSDGTQVTSGLMSAEMPVQLESASSPYYHMVISAGTASFMVKATGVAWAVDGNLSDEGLHLLGQATPIYFHVPDTTRQFQLSLAATPPGETAIATLHAPDSRSIAKFDCTSVPVDRQRIDVATGQAGWWKLDIQQAPTGAIDDVWIKLGDELSGYFSFVPDQALSVRDR